MATCLESFSRVSEDYPCPICGRPDWCMISHDGTQAVCKRVPSDARWRTGFMHWLRGKVPVPPAVHETPKLPPAVVNTLAMRWMRELTHDRATAFVRQMHLSVRSLDRMCMGWNPRLECYTFPMRDVDFNIVGARYRFPNGEKRSLKGGAEGLFLPTSSVGGDTLFVTEGPTDCAALLDCHLDAIGRPNNLGGIDEIAEIVARFHVPIVVIVDDRDGPGRLGGDMLFDKLKSAGGCTVKRIVPRASKDARDCTRSGGRRQFILGALEGRSNPFWTMPEFGARRA